MTSIMAPALSSFIIKSNVGARNNSKSAYSPWSSSSFWLWCKGSDFIYGIWSRYALITIRSGFILLSDIIP